MHGGEKSALFKYCVNSIWKGLFFMADENNKPKKNDGYQRYDWNVLKTEYVTTNISLKDLAQKHGIRKQTVYKRSAEGGWVEARKKHLKKVSDKAISKVGTKQANQLAKEARIAERLSDALDKALEDTLQFNRHLVDTRTKMGGTEIQTVEEKVYDKVDMRALKDAAQTLKLVEEMKRSLYNIQKMDEINKEKREQRKLEMDEEKLKMEHERIQMQREQTENSKPDQNITVTIKGYDEGWSD